jgi:hypothetical protein
MLGMFPSPPSCLAPCPPLHTLSPKKIVENQKSFQNICLQKSIRFCLEKISKSDFRRATFSLHPPTSSEESGKGGTAAVCHGEPSCGTDTRPLRWPRMQGDVGGIENGNHGCLSLDARQRGGGGATLGGISDQRPRRGGILALENARTRMSARNCTQGTRQGAWRIRMPFDPWVLASPPQSGFMGIQSQRAQPLNELRSYSPFPQTLAVQVTTELLPTQLRLWSRIVTGHQLFGTRFGLQTDPNHSAPARISSACPASIHLHAFLAAASCLLGSGRD